MFARVVLLTASQVLLCAAAEEGVSSKDRLETALASAKVRSGMELRPAQGGHGPQLKLAPSELKIEPRRSERDCDVMPYGPHLIGCVMIVFDHP